MGSEFVLPDGPTAFVFPGQGAQSADMLEPLRGEPGFARNYERVAELLGTDPLGDPAALNANAVSSMLTVLAGVLALERIRAEHPSFEPAAVAGYSVGQWTALFAAGALDAATLFEVVAARARFMDDAIAAAGPTGMLAAIGVRRADVEAVCVESTRDGPALELTNVNAPGQYTVGGTEEALVRAEARLRELRPKRLQRVPVAGAWHSRFLAGAATRLAGFLDSVELRPTRIPIVDNVTGRWLPEALPERRAALARQVASPVLWEDGVRTMAAAGVRHLVEVGSGDLLTKFGFFIDRSLTHRAVLPPPRVRS